MNPILQPYVGVAELIVRTFGSDVEVVLHDLTTPAHSVVYVANNTVTGRKPGDTFEHLFEESLKNPNPEHGVIANYYFHAQGKLIRSSSLLIRDAEGTLCAAMCINIDTTRVTDAIADLQNCLPGLTAGIATQAVTARPSASKAAPVQLNTDAGTASDNTADNNANTGASTLTEFAESLISNLIRGVDTHALTKEERQKLIGFMETRGVFQLKGAVDTVAEKLGIARVTVYSDLDQIRKH